MKKKEKKEKKEKKSPQMIVNPQILIRRIGDVTYLMY